MANEFVWSDLSVGRWLKLLNADADEIQQTIGEDVDRARLVCPAVEDDSNSDDSDDDDDEDDEDEEMEEEEEEEVEAIWNRLFELPNLELSFPVVNTKSLILFLPVGTPKPSSSPRSLRIILPRDTVVEPLTDFAALHNFVRHFDTLEVVIQNFTVSLLFLWGFMPIDTSITMPQRVTVECHTSSCVTRLDAMICLVDVILLCALLRRAYHCFFSCYYW